MKTIIARTLLFCLALVSASGCISGAGKAGLGNSGAAPSCFNVNGITYLWLLRYNPQLNGYRNFLTEAPTDLPVILPDGSTCRLYQLKPFWDFNFRINHSVNMNDFNETDKAIYADFSLRMKRLMALPECRDFLATRYGGDVEADAILGRWRRADKLIGVNLKRNNNSSMGYSNGREIFIGPVIARHCAWVFMHETTHCIAGGEVFAYPCGYWFGSANNMKLADYAVVDPNGINLPHPFADITLPYKPDTSECHANGDLLRETRKNKMNEISTTFYGYQQSTANLGTRTNAVTVECDGMGVLHGSIREFHPNGRIREERPYEHGVLSGKVIRCAETGKVLFEASYTNGLLEGMVTRYSLDKAGNPVMTYRSEYRANQRQGVTEKYRPDGSLETRENYKNDVLDGLSEAFDAKGEKTSSTEYRLGKPVSGPGK